MAGGGGASRTVTLRGCDGARVTVSAETMAAAAVGGLRDGSSRSRSRAADADGADVVVVSVPDATGPVLARLADYCDRHYGGGGGEAFRVPEGFGFDDPLQRFDDELMGGADLDTVLGLLDAATYLGIEKLVELACKEMADVMRGKPLEKIRELFNIVNDYTKEEEEEVRKENSWAFDN